MTTKNATPKKLIPEFKDIKEEAEFWDTHDTADYEDAFTPTRVRFSRGLSQGLTVRLDTETLTQLRVLAQEKGLGPTTLARMWLLERLRQETPKAR